MKFILVSIVAVVSFFNLRAQVKDKPVLKTEIVPLVYQAYWGPVKSGMVSAAQIKASAQAPIIVRDNNNTSNEVISFRISYAFKGSMKDEQSGEVKPVSDLRVSDFNNTNTLSAPWYESIRDNAKEGDEILLNKIIFKSSTGRRLLAPDIRIRVR